jgi:hypothetical protein
VAGYRDGFEPGMHAKRSQQVADMIAHCFRTELKLLRDLLGRAATLEQAQYLRLARSEMRWRRVFGLFLDIRHLPEDPDHAMTLHQRARADVDLKATAVRIQEDDLRVGHLRRAGDLAGKVLSCPASIFMGYDRGELSSAHVADKTPRRGVDPADDSGRIDHVTGDVDGLERLLDVTADFPEPRHVRDAGPGLLDRSPLLTSLYGARSPQTGARARA